MDASKLAQTMLEWEAAQLHADELKAQIEAAVLELGKTQTAGNVKATFYNGRKVYDYALAAIDHPMVSKETVSLFKKVVETVDWRGICKHAGIEDIPFTQSAPSVTVKLAESNA